MRGCATALEKLVDLARRNDVPLAPGDRRRAVLVAAQQQQFNGAIDKVGGPWKRLAWAAWRPACNRHAILGNYLPAICHAAAAGRSTPNERFVGTIRGSGECQTG
jgi:hypothetical protein